MSAPEPAAPAAATQVRLEGLVKAFGSTLAVDDFSLELPRGSFTTLLGPSGCGKTTVLRMIAGFVEPDSGVVSIGGVDQRGRPPNLRGVGMVFQDYALFPHMTVLSNVEYGLRMQRVPRRLRRERATRTLGLLGLDALAQRYPHQLSGGQQQRVALGRVMVLEPQLLLMDEPLSNLDAKLRLRLRAELKALQQRFGVTTLYVTHDQDEALTLSDTVVVMQAGRVQQVGTPEEVYGQPANRFVAEFVGTANLLPAVVTRSTPDGVLVMAAGKPLAARSGHGRVPTVGDSGWVMVRPENVVLGSAPEAGGGQGWSVGAKVLSREFGGATERYRLELAGGAGTWLADARSVPAADAAPYAAGSEVELSLEPGAATWLPDASTGPGSGTDTPQGG